MVTQCLTCDAGSQASQGAQGAVAHVPRVSRVNSLQIMAALSALSLCFSNPRKRLDKHVPLVLWYVSAARGQDKCVDCSWNFFKQHRSYCMCTMSSRQESNSECSVNLQGLGAIQIKMDFSPGSFANAFQCTSCPAGCPRTRAVSNQLQV